MTKTELAIARCLTTTQARLIAKRAKAMVDASLFGLNLKPAHCILCMEAEKKNIYKPMQDDCVYCRLPKQEPGWVTNRCYFFVINGQTGSKVDIDLTYPIRAGRGLTRAEIAWLEGVIAICKERLSKVK